MQYIKRITKSVCTLARFPPPLSFPLPSGSPAGQGETTEGRMASRRSPNTGTVTAECAQICSISLNSLTLCKDHLNTWLRNETVGGGRWSGIARKARWGRVLYWSKTLTSSFSGNYSVSQHPILCPFSTLFQLEHNNIGGKSISHINMEYVFHVFYSIYHPH